MSFSYKFLRFIAASLLMISLAVVAFADTIRLKDGSIIKGKITAFGGGKFTVVMGEGSRRKELTFFANEIESIIFDSQDAKPQLTTPTRTTVSKQPEQTPDPQPARVVLTSGTRGPSPSQTTPPAATMKPVGWSVKVLADNTANGWTNTGWVVKKGQRIRITGDGKVSLGKNKSSSPSGEPDIEDGQKLLKNVATGALIAVIGDDNNEFIYIGSEREFTATRDGALFLGINEGYLDDNTGSYSVKVEIIPDGR
ncbi:MAG: LecA/PA-IL family lectin [Pyrinomonadaceae bacterium]